MILMDGNMSSPQKLKDKTQNILGIIQNLGIVLSVIILMIIGIKYMLGSVEEKSEYKKTMIPYLIGAAIVFSGTTLPQIIYQLASNI